MGNEQEVKQCLQFYQDVIKDLVLQKDPLLGYHLKQRIFDSLDAVIGLESDSNKVLDEKVEAILKLDSVFGLAKDHLEKHQYSFIGFDTALQEILLSFHGCTEKLLKALDEMGTEGGFCDESNKGR